MTPPINKSLGPDDLFHCNENTPTGFDTDLLPQKSPEGPTSPLSCPFSGVIQPPLQLYHCTDPTKSVFSPSPDWVPEGSNYTIVIV